MSLIDKLASSLGRRDDLPNQELAKEIADTDNKKGVQELVTHLSDNKKDTQSDCIKVLYEIGAIKPNLIAGYADDFIMLLNRKNNRLQWGAMTALNSIAALKPEAVYGSLPKLADVAEKGSVITKDNYIAILIQLCSVKKYQSDVFSLLNEQLFSALPNQLPMYAEQALSVIDTANKGAFITTLTARLNDLEKESKKKRVEKVLRKAHAI